MGVLTDLTTKNRHAGVNGKSCGKELYDTYPEHELQEVVEALAFAGYPPVAIKMRSWYINHDHPLDGWFFLRL